jgi:carboxylesterase
VTTTTVLPFFSAPQHAPFVLGDGPGQALLIHGFPGTPAEMRPMATLLARAGWQAHGLLLPGMGADIARLPEMRQSLWLDAARAAWLARLAADPAALLVGNSMGAALALRLAAEAPPGRLILVSPFWNLGGLGTLLPLLKHVIRTFAPFSRANFGDPVLRRELQRLAPGIDLDDPTTVSELRTQLRVSTAVLDEVRLLGLAAHEAAGRVRAPVLVLQGTDDRVVRRGSTRRLLLRLAGPVEYHELPAEHDLVLLDGPTGKQATFIVETSLRTAGPTAGLTAGPTTGREPGPCSAT